ncbi:MAG: hypothetical protein ACE14S_01985 [Candidatus Bathyarchaeia archaeon]
MQKRVNWLGLAGGAATLSLVVVSVFVPWWILKLGDPQHALVEANVSPVNTHLEGLGDSFTTPLLWAVNIAGALSLAAGGIVMLVYSVLPAKPYSRRLLGFSYRKPLYLVAFFVASLFLLALIANGFGYNLPLTGSANVQLPKSMTPGATISALVTADFQWSFWLAIATAGLCLAARVYHKRVGVAPLPAKA